MNRRKDRSKYEILLIVTFVGVLALFYFLNFYPDRKPGKDNLIICGIQLGLSLVIFLNAFRIFLQTNKMVEDLNRVSGEIQEGSLTNGGEIEFHTGILNNEYGRYQAEVKRLSGIANNYSLCDIEDYINHSLVDRCIHRSLLNLIPGVMTGLGILGTFVGLALGLRAFNTGTAEEISNSIAPLMDGIKVAFHTSIYGMILSLVFNYVYKKKLGIADEAMDTFLDAYHRVLGNNPENEAVNRILQFQENQKITSARLAKNLSDAITAKLAQVLVPQFEQMNTAVNQFTEAASQGQVLGMEKLADRFVESLNKSMGANFAALGQSLAETCNMQKEQCAYIQKLLDRTDGTINSLQKINDTTLISVEKMHSCISGMEQLQADLNESFRQFGEQEKTSLQAIEKFRDYVSSMNTYLQEMKEAALNFSSSADAQAAAVREMAAETTSGIEQNMNKVLQDFDSTLSRLSAQVSAFAEELRQSQSAADEGTRLKIREITESLGAGRERIEKSVQESIQRSEESQAKRLDSLELSQAKSLEILKQNQTKSMELLEQSQAKSLENLQQMQNGLQDAVKTAADTVQQQVDDYISRLSRSAEDVEKKISGTAEETQSSMMASMNQFVDSVNRLTDETIARSKNRFSWFRRKKNTSHNGEDVQ